MIELETAASENTGTMKAQLERLTSIADKIKHFVHRMDNVGFGELMRAIPDSAGSEIIYGENKSLIIWEGVSREFANAIEALLREQAVTCRPTTMVVHLLAEGQILHYPIAKRVRKYVEPHWMPVFLCKPKANALRRK